MRQSGLRDTEVDSNTHYWITVMGPGQESTHDWLTIGLPFRDEHGQITWWEVPGGSQPHGSIRTVLEKIPWPGGEFCPECRSNEVLSRAWCPTCGWHR